MIAKYSNRDEYRGQPAEKLMQEYFDENQDDEQKFQSAKIEGFEDRFSKSLASRSAG